MPDVYINGEFVPEGEAKISVFDRAVQLGDGLFETVRGHLGKPAFLDRHLARMRCSAAFLKLPFNYTDPDIRNVLTKLCERNRASEARIRLTLTRGVHPGGLSLEGGEPCFFVTAEKYVPYPSEKYEKGYRLTVSEIIHQSKGPLSGHKTLNYIIFLLARDEAHAAGADEALLLNEKGDVAECSSANVFAVRGGTVLTPDLDSGILPGVIRDVIISLAEKEGIPVEQRPVPLAELLEADEVFITSSLRGIMPVSQIGEESFSGKRPVTRKLSSLYSAALDAACRG